MPIKVRCPKCGQKIKYMHAPAGKVGKCPRCGEAVITFEADADTGRIPQLAPHPVAEVQEEDTQEIEAPDLPATPPAPPPLKPPPPVYVAPPPVPPVYSPPSAPAHYAYAAPPAGFAPAPAAPPPPVMPRRRSLFGRSSGRPAAPPARGTLARRGVQVPFGPPSGFPAGYVPSVWGEVAAFFILGWIPILGIILFFVFYGRARQLHRHFGRMPPGAWVFYLILAVNLALTLAAVWFFLNAGFGGSERRSRREASGPPEIERRAAGGSRTSTGDTREPVEPAKPAPYDPWSDPGTRGNDTDGAKRRKSGGGEEAGRVCPVCGGVGRWNVKEKLERESKDYALAKVAEMEDATRRLGGEGLKAGDREDLMEVYKSEYLRQHLGELYAVDADGMKSCGACGGTGRVPK